MAAASHLSHLSPIDRPDSRVSLARSDTTYHSFQDDEIYEPDIPSEPNQRPVVCPPPDLSPSKREQRPGREMRRQDSGYESIAPRDSLCSSRRRTSTTSPSSSTRQRRSKPSTPQSSTKPGPVCHRPRTSRHSNSNPGSSHSLSSQQQHQQVTYFHFPHFTSSDPSLAMDEPESLRQAPGYLTTGTISTPPTSYINPTATTALTTPATTAYLALRTNSPTPTNAHPLPPQTTQYYWTSDRTRRLEYAAIDAASKGVRGWVMRHVVPDCLVPESRRRVGFEDDRGSVVRYRLDLDESASTLEGKHEKGEVDAEGVRVGKWRGWWFSMRRR
ncbi:hypothetical protein VTI74DRAFT_9602 [Chaetomium olivicolor]